MTGTSRARAALVAAVVGVVAFAAGWVCSTANRVERHTDDPRAAHGDVSDEVLFSCEYHGKVFHDADEARQHAVERHNAPKDGEMWKHTYKEGRE